MLQSSRGSMRTVYVRWLSSVSPINWKIIRKDIEKMHRTTSNAIVQLNNNVQKSMEADKINVLNEKIGNLQRKMEKLNLLSDIIADAPENCSADVIGKAQIIAKQLRISLNSRTEKTISTKQAPMPEKGHRRKPFISYSSSDGIAIRVGRSAEDNDKLSTSTEYRHDDDWWLHVAGCSGSHVVIRNRDDAFPSKYPATLKEAAYLAVLHSKNSSPKANVSYTRCKCVTKKSGDPAGLVRLSHAATESLSVSVKNLPTAIQSVLDTKQY